jgi:hypothetical protein
MPVIGLEYLIRQRDGLVLAMKGDATSPDIGTENAGAWSTIIVGIAIMTVGTAIAIRVRAVPTAPA